MIMRLFFAGRVAKAIPKTVSDETMVEVSICKKEKGRNGGEDTFTWIRATIWKCPDFMVAKLVKGAFIAGSGEFKLRSYEKDGEKRQSAEVSCRSFDVEVSDGAPADGQSEPPPRAPAPTRPTRPAAGADDEPPF